MAENLTEFTGKLVVAGAGGVGKTALVQRFTTNTFIQDHKMTIGAAFYVKDLVIDSTYKMSLRIWDFAGEERFRFILGQYCRGASGALVCFDVTDYETFRDIREWLQIIKSEIEGIPIILVGTKFDLPEHQITYEMADEYAKQTECVGVAFTSSKENLNVTETFESISRWMISFQLNKKESK
ncbi:MAG: Rab family GTPase [Promethearchaeota archaeon]